MRFFLALPFLLLPFILNAQIISTIAGTGVYGITGDGGPAVNATLGEMYYCYPAIDKQGNVYIAQQSENIIRKIDVNGIITTIAGKPWVYGPAGDGGPAKDALLSHPTAIVVDENNNIIFSDLAGAIVRKIDANGIIATISGPQTDGCIIGDGGTLKSAGFRAISAISLDKKGNLYISDFGCNVVRKVDASGIITTIAGNGTIGFSGDGGLATAAQLAYPCQVAADEAGNIFIADAQNHRIRKVGTNGIITTAAGTGTAGYSGDGGQAIAATLYYPGGIVFDNAGSMYVGDYNCAMRKIDKSGIISTYAGTGLGGYTGDGGPATLANIGLTEGRISIDNNNNIYFADNVNYVIRKISGCLTAAVTAHSGNNYLCNAGNAIFSINASSASNYQWQVWQGQGWADVKDNAIYSGATTAKLRVAGAGITMNKFAYRCFAGNTCGAISSFPDTLFVQSPAMPAITIVTPADTVCSGTAVTFTATAVNGGSNPVYKWQKNGIDMIQAGNFFTDNAIKDHDQVRCLLISNNTCISENNVTSNAIEIFVNPLLTPQVSISSSSTNICSGIMVDFYAAVVNSGGTTTYSWKKNGIPAGANNKAYHDNALKNNDIISCTVTSTYACQTETTIESNPIIMQVQQPVTPSVSITALSSTICPGKPATLTATIYNAGTNPELSWYKNGVLTGETGYNYISAVNSSGDMFLCKLITSGSCITSPETESNTVIVSIFNVPMPALDKNDAICEGGSRVLNPGNFISYLWNDGSFANTLTVAKPGTYYVSVVDKNGCTASDTAVVSKLLNNPSGFLAADTAICSYEQLVIKPAITFSRYLWSDNSTASSIEIKSPGTYWLAATDQNNCTGKDTIKVLPKQCMHGFFIPSAFTPNNDGKNDIFRPLLFGSIISYRFVIYNRWGAIIFQSADPSRGWNGAISGISQQQGSFIWVCTYQLEGGKKETKKGTFVLVR